MRRSLFVAAGALLLLALSLPLLQAGCALNPVSGRPQVVLVSEQAEQRIGRGEAAKVAEAMGLVKSPALNAYIQEVGKRLAAVTPASQAVYSWQIVDQPEPNAFALPGGPTYVSRGLLALLNSEAELAGVMGHEMGHVAARHATRRLTVGAPFAIAFGLPAALVGVVSPTLGKIVGIPGAVAQGLVLAPYARSQEHDADEIGMQLAAKAGWQPGALADALETMERESVLRQGEARQAAFFDTHPLTRDRLQRIRAKAAELPIAAKPPIAADRAAFYARLDGLLVGNDPKGGVFDGNDFLHPVLGLVVSFPKGWRTENHDQMVLAMPAGAGDGGSKGRVFTLLQQSAQGDDPMAGAEADAIGPEWLAKVERTRIGGLPAARLVAVNKGVAYDLTWYALGSSVYRVTGACPAAEQARWQQTFQRMAHSFRPLARADRSRIRAKRLRVVRARAGETLAALLRRVDNAWKPEAVAIANGVALDEPLTKGQAVKVVRAEPYTGGP